jgi:hypothetical protein
LRRWRWRLCLWLLLLLRCLLALQRRHACARSGLRCLAIHALVFALLDWAILVGTGAALYFLLRRSRIACAHFD